MPTWSDQDIVPLQAQDICTQHKILLPLISEQCSYPKQDVGPAQNITLLSVKTKTVPIQQHYIVSKEIR